MHFFPSLYPITLLFRDMVFYGASMVKVISLRSIENIEIIHGKYLLNFTLILVVKKLTDSVYMIIIFV